MPTTLQNEVQKHLRYNFIVNVLDGAFFGLAIGFSSFSAFIPIFVNRLTNSAVLIGLVPALHAVGWQFPQLFTASWTARLRHLKPVVISMTLFERIPFFGLALVAWFLPALGKQNALILTFLLLAWQGLGGGFTANAWTTMIGKIIPSEIRGSFFGAQSAAANGLLSVGSILAGLILSKISDRYDFSLLFLITGSIMLVSLFFLGITREPVDHEKHVPEKKQPFWIGTRTILKRDVNFRWFLAVRLLSQFASMGFAFYIIYAINHFGMNEFTAGILSATLTGVVIVASPSMGWAGDRWGHRRLLILGMVAATVSSLLAWLAPSLNWFYLIMVLTALANVAIWTIAIILTVEFGNESERPVYIGLSNTLIAPATIIAPLLGGWLADQVSYPFMFFCTAVGGVLTLAVLYFFFKEPLKLEHKPAEIILEQ
jgi:MFS family permease